MAYELVGKEWCQIQQDYRLSFIVDTEADIETMPDSIVGSNALVVDTGAIYMVNASGNWVPFGG